MSLTFDLERLCGEREAVIHPTVLLSVVDHHMRVAKGTKKRVVGTLLGSADRDGSIRITNSFAVPFEEDPTDPTVWFLDHSYHEAMYGMFRKVNRRERVVGWYSTAARMKAADLQVHEVFRKYTPHPVCVIVDVEPQKEGLPTEAYMAFEEPTNESSFRRTFVRIPSTMGAVEAEEVGVEHLLRDLQGSWCDSIGTQTDGKMKALGTLAAKLQSASEYVREVNAGSVPLSARVLYNLQEILALQPDFEDAAVREAFGVMTGEAMLSIYVGCVARLVLAMHDLINNQLEESRALAAKQADAARRKAGADTPSTAVTASPSA